MKKKVLAPLLGAMAFICGLFAMNTGIESQTLAAENVFEMTPGGSIRIAEPYGLRFQVKMSADVKEKAEKVGMLIFPADYLVDNGTDGDVYYENVEALANTTNPKHRIKLDLTQKLYEKDGYWYGNGVIVNIKGKNMSRDFVGIAYYETNDEIVWADTSKIANTTRSAAQVALLAHADKTSIYAAETDQLLLDYIGYTKDSDLKDIQIGAIPLFVDNGADTAKSYWKAEYVDGGVKVTVDVTDEHVSIDESSDKGYSDNIEFQIQAVDNLWTTKDYSINFLCNARGEYWIRRYEPYNYKNITLNNDPTVENDELYYQCNVTDIGYQVKVFVSYDILNVTEEEAKGNVRICPMLRNRTDASHNVCEVSSLIGCYYHVPTTWFVLKENNLFTRTDLEEFTLASRNAEAKEMIANMASLQAGEGSTMAKTEIGAHYRTNNNVCFDGLARDLVGTDYILSASETRRATVTEEGYVIICVREDNTTLKNNLTSAGWTLVADKCRAATGVMAGTSWSSYSTTSYYAKFCMKDEVIETTGDYNMVFGKAGADTTEAVYKNNPAYISFEAVDDDYYADDNLEFSGCPTVAVTNGGRLYAGFMTGGTYEPHEKNCNIIKYSDDGGKTWESLFVIDTWDDEIIEGTKQTISLDVELRTDPETNVVYVSYYMRKNVNDGMSLGATSWMFTISNPDSIEMTKEALEISEQWNTNMEMVRNGFTILKNGNFIIAPNGMEHSETNPVYISEDKGQTWKCVGNIYFSNATNFDEPIIVEKLDGSLWCTVRTTTGYVHESFSYDGGQTWTIGKKTDIKNPCSRFTINRLASGNLMMAYSDNSSGRIGMVIAISEDDGATWENKLCLYDGVASYPVIALDYSSGEEVIHIVFDDGRYYANQWRTGEEDGKKYEYYAQIFHATMTEADIMAGGDPSEDELEFLAVGDSYTTPQFWLSFESSFGTYGGETIGIGGTKVADWNTEGKIAEIVTKNPKNLFINLGINDIGAGTDGTTLGNALVAYLEALKAALPDTKIYYNMMVYPSNTNYNYKAIDMSNDIVKAYIDGDATDNIYKIDIREKMMIMAEADARKFTDTLHMTTEAYAILSDAIRRETGIGQTVDELNVVTRFSKRLYDYAWTEWEDCGIQSDAPTRYNVRGYAAENGLYINAVQYVDNIVSTGDKWNEQTHLEAQIWQHNMGQGVNNGFNVDTYCAFWLDGSSWFNNYTNIGTVKNHVTITDRGENYVGGYRYEICYEIFIPFENNVGSADGPYAYVQFKHHMPGETEEGFEYANREFRDNARYLWQDDCSSYEFRNTGIVTKDVDYKNVGTISGTDVATWDLNVYRGKNAFYLEASTSDSIDASVNTGINLYMNFGQPTLNRTENTYKFEVYMKNGTVTGGPHNYPNGSATSVKLPYVGYNYKVTSGKTFMYLMIPYDSFPDAINTDEVAITFQSGRGSTYHNWVYSGCQVYYGQPLKYLTITEDNEMYLLGEKALQATVEANNALKDGYEDVFANLAYISASSGSMKLIADKENMFANRLTQDYKFQTVEAKFLEGKAFTYANIAEGSFKVLKDGYVFLLVPGGSGAAIYPTTRAKVEADGWKKIFNDWNKMYSLRDPICYYVKWCETGETYSYGQFNIAIADPASFMTIEDYRPQLHFSTRDGFMNDPNGLVYDPSNQTWHMFYQLTPGSTTGGWYEGTIVWGHAVSDDLVNWSELPIAIKGDEFGAAWSGSCVVDEDNTSGFFTDNKEGESKLVAMYTSAGAGVFPQSLAYSKDHGVTWIKYRTAEGQPVLPDVYPDDVRDPKIFKIPGDEKNLWYMVMAGGRGRIFVSENLKEWTLIQELTYPDGSELYSECPDLYPLEVLDKDGNTTETTKWVYNAGSEFYVIGDMIKGDDGYYRFHAEAKIDSQTGGNSNAYAAQTYYNDPVSGRRITVHWMQDWSAPEVISTKRWNGVQSFPMETTLKVINDGYTVVQNPVEEVKQLRGDVLYSKKNITVSETSDNILAGITGQVYEIEAVFSNFAEASEFGFELRTGNGQKTVYKYDVQNQTVTLDKSLSGVYDNDVLSWSLTPRSDGTIKLRAIVDKSVIETYANDGDVHLIDLLFADESSVGMSFYTEGGSVTIDEITVYDMKSIYTGESVIQ